VIARLGHDVHGDPAAPVLVLGGSLGTTREMWEPQLAALAERYLVVRYEHRGHGDSEAPTDDCTIEDLSADVLALLDQLGVERFMYAGVSLGGMVGMWLASQPGGRVDRLALICTSAAPGNPDAWHERARTVREQGMTSVVAAVAGRWFEASWAHEHGDVVDRFTTDFCSRMDPVTYAACCDALAVMDLRDGLSSITAPTLVVGGADDLALPVEPHSRTIVDGIPGARLEVVDRAAHLASVDRSDACTPLLLDHFGGPS
jgi:3-oxoadipate enol-lactonase